VASGSCGLCYNRSDVGPNWLSRALLGLSLEVSGLLLLVQYRFGLMVT